MKAARVWVWRENMVLHIIDEGDDSGLTAFTAVSRKRPDLPPVPLQPFSRFKSLYSLNISCLLADRESAQEEMDWVICREEDGKPVQTAGALRMIFLLRTPACRTKEGFIVYPIAGEGKSLTFRVRRKQFYDGFSFWLKARLVFAGFVIRKAVHLRPRGLVIFEKFSGRAEDNGFAFFSYCMEKAGEKRKRHIYFILDRRSPAYEKLKRQYGKQIVPFMSARHMRLMLTAAAYAASESKAHGYGWKAIPDPVFHEIRTGNHPILFLQHGVTALKKVDGIFGKNGSDPMTWFAVTSKAEQELVMRNFGYEEKEVPILGFPRWDYVRRQYHKTPRFFLMMPTWRKWLEDASQETFLTSEYYKAYLELTEDSSLHRMLSETGTRLVFCLHPKLSKWMKSFEKAGRGFGAVDFVFADGEAVSRLIEECSALITDYSSVSWDAYYLGKPVLFYQFDLVRYQKETGSYLDLEKDLFGPAFRQKEALIRGMEECADSGFAERKADTEKRKQYFAWNDTHNCQRVLKFLEEKGCLPSQKY